MDVAIPPEFEAYARAQVEAGTYRTEAEAVATALRNHLARPEELRAEVAIGIASFDCGEGVDGEAATRALIEDARRRHGKQSRYRSHS